MTCSSRRGKRGKERAVDGNRVRAEQKCTPPIPRYSLGTPHQ